MDQWVEAVEKKTLYMRKRHISVSSKSKTAQNPLIISSFQAPKLEVPLKDQFYRSLTSKPNVRSFLSNKRVRQEIL